MHFVYREGCTERELELHAGRPDATVRDLACALGAPDGVLIDGRGFPPETGLGESGLVMGSLLMPAARRAGPDRKPVAILRVVGGIQAGMTVPLLPGRLVIGRGNNAGLILNVLDLSRAHCALDVNPDGTVVLTDLGSANGTDVNGVRLTSPVPVSAGDLVSLAGRVLLRILPADGPGPVRHINPVREARPGGTLPFTRAPRLAAPAEPPPVTLPEPPRSMGPASFKISAMLTPLLLAAVVVIVMKNPAYAVIAAVTPLAFLADFAETRSRGRVSVRRSKRRYAAELDEARHVLERRRADEVRKRQQAATDPAEALFRAQAPGLRLWERRQNHSDFLHVSVGSADLPWQPPVKTDARTLDPEAKAMLAGVAALPQVPVMAGISAGEVLGLEGPRQAALAAARALLCQAVVDSGPADVTVAVFADEDRIADWDWTKWLPHGADLQSGSARFVAVGPKPSGELIGRLPATSPPSPGNGGEQQPPPVILVVVDGAALLEGRPCPLRELLATASVPCGGIVLTDRLPAVCTSILTVDAEGGGTLKSVTTGEETAGILVDSVSEVHARRLARALARFEDPELKIIGAGLPGQVTLLPLLDLPEVAGPSVAKRWRDNVSALQARAVLGVGEQDLFTIDLDVDGPHGMIAGTTGSGKSELLRTLIVSMATETDPEHLTFVLVDYKGGGALDECARLPHVVGLVTDLDEQLGERALRCMEAELRRREHALRDVSLDHICDYQKLRDTEHGDLEPMPRLVVVIDEFATLVKALPDFVDSLISIAQRGRSLGIHLIMATQRPAGAVSENIKANVQLRICLRVEDDGDSRDVIDSPAAAGIGKRQRGRAYYRLSAREVQPVQTALSTGVTPRTAERAAVTLTPFRLINPAPDGPARDQEGPSDLRRLVDAAREASRLAGIAPQRSPWPDPLPPVVNLRDLPPAARGLQTGSRDLPALALADDPDQQARYPAGWDPEAGNLLIYGAVGAGTTTTLAALALTTARAHPPDRLHLFVLDMGAGDLAPLAGLPHAGAVITAAERERQIRLIRMLRRELDARKAGAQYVPWLVLIDNLGALIADYDKDVAGMSLVEDLARVYADGPGVGIRFAATADRGGAVPHAWSTLTQQKLVMRLADPQEYGNFDLPRASVPRYVPGRAVVAATRQVIQIGFPGPHLPGAVDAVAARWPAVTRTAPGVGQLPREITAAQLGTRARAYHEPWEIPVGIGDRELSPVSLTLYEHEHALITGPPRSGRSQALCMIAQAVLAADNPPAVIAFAPRRSPVRHLMPPASVVTAYACLDDALAAADSHTLVLVDDAETVDDGPGVLDRWLAGAPAGRHLIAAGRADGIRRIFGGWTQRVRDGRCGVLLVPDYDLDGDLLGVTLPRQDRMAPVPGRGYLVTNGTVEGVQLACPA